MPVRNLAERTRQPTGLTSNPLILVSGEELSGKTYTAALLTASQRVGPSWLMQLGETDGDQYGAIIDPQGHKVRYSLVDTDGTWIDIVAAAEQVHEAGTAYAEANPAGPPPVWIFDSATIEWELLSGWANNRARTSNAGKKALAEDPNADIDVGRMHWNAANRRHNQLMRLFTTFPGIVVLTARGKWVSPTDKKGQPIAHAPKEYTIEAQKHLGFRSSVWVRLSRDEAPTIVGARLANGGIHPGKDRPMVIDGRRDDRFRGVDFSLEWLVFDWLKYDPAASVVRRLNEPVPGDEADDADVAEALGVSLTCYAMLKTIDTAETTNDLNAVWEDMKAAGDRQEITRREFDLAKARMGERAAAIRASTAPVVAGARPATMGAAA